MFLNDIESVFYEKGLDGIDIDSLKIFFILYADDIVLFVNSDTELRNSLDTLSDYCKRWKLVVNTGKTKVMVFRKGGRLPKNCTFL